MRFWLPEKWKKSESLGCASLTSQCIARMMFAFVGWLSGLAWSSVKITMSSLRYP